MKKIVVGILAHVDSGKTTLIEALMYTSGNISRLGRVDHRDSFLDTFSLERDRGITIFSKQAVLSYHHTDFTLLDTPGHVDFSAETERTLQVLDYAVLVISGTDGVQSHTVTLWKLLQRYNVPCFIFVNKMDLEAADSAPVLTQLKNKLSDRCVDFGCEGSSEFYENIAVCDDRLLEQYASGDGLHTQDIVSAIKARQVFPCLFGSALKLQGIDRLLACLDKYAAMPPYGSDFGAKVFKIAEDPQKNRLTYLKITGGSLKVKDILPSDRNHQHEKVHQIRIYSGEKFIACDEAAAGTVCAVTGVTFTRPGDGLGAEENTGLPFLEPVLTYAVILPPDTDAHTVLSKLKILESEDPLLNVMWNERSGEIQVQLMGEIQLEILRAILTERFGLTVEFGQGGIIYKETITDTVEGVGHFEPLRHYAEVHLILKPAKRDSGLVFDTSCKEDVLDKNWQRLILTHLYEKTHLGVLTGSPVTDMEITLASGKAHIKHTEGGDFRQATYRAVRQGLRSADSVLLEPVYTFSLEVPTENIGRAMTDIRRMAGSCCPPETNGDFSRLTGTAPVSEMRDYAKEVLQYTHGRGRLSCSLKGYDVCHNADQVIAAIGYDPDADPDNPCDSVFCSHGAGHPVKWDEVKRHMHLPAVLNEPRTDASEHDRADVLAKASSAKDIFALDKELMRIFENTYGPIKRRTADSVRRHVSAPQVSKETPKRPKQPSYDGTEYLLVDGYNVIHAWDTLRMLADGNMEGARNHLINILCNYQGYKKCELILVFDAYLVKGSDREVETIGNINVVYTKEAETADMYIEKVSHKLARRHRVRVVTSDRMEQLIIIGNGAIRVSSQEFYDEVKSIENEIREIISGSFASPAAGRSGPQGGTL